MKHKKTAVKAWEGEISIPTYKIGPEDQNPPLLINRKNVIHPGSSIIYPYPLNENLTDIREDRIWKALFIENDFLRITLLPDLGGRLLSVLDKSSGEEAMYRNHVLKFARIGIRGAWASGGIEWNFPNGHTVTTSSPIDYAIRENRDGSKTIVIGDIEKVSRMRWSVGITLYEDYAFFETETRLFNRTNLPNRYWFWANSAAPASEGLEFITTATKVMTLTDVIDFPIHNGVNLRWNRNHIEAQDLFSLDLKEDFVAWYNHDLKRGMINYADRTEATGKKFYTWGNSGDGKIWTGLLTDSDGPYSEMQSGRLPTMRIWEMLSPVSEETWKEVWYPIRKIGAPVFVNKEAAFSFSCLEDKIHIGIHVTSSQQNAEISLYADRDTIWNKRIDLEPGRPYTSEFQFDAKKLKNKKIRLLLTNDRGETLTEYGRDKEAENEPEVKGYFKIEPVSKTMRAEDQWKTGLDYEKTGESNSAEEAYNNALKDDPGFSPAHRSLGILHFRRGSFDKAVAELKSTLERNSTDECARFFLGACFISMEKLKKAIAELRMLSRSHKYGAASSYLLGGLYLGEGKINEAVEQLKKSIRLYPGNLDAGAFLSCGLRKKKMFKEAGSCVQSILINDPLNFPALAESYFIAEELETGNTLEKKKQNLIELLRDNFQSYLELATDYARFGLLKEGIKILSLLPGDKNKAEIKHPLILYYMGYYSEQIGKSEEAKKYYKLGAEADPSFVFPHRLETEAVLRCVIKSVPEDWKALYYLGNLLCSKDRYAEAIKFWGQAAQKEKKFSVVHRNLGLAYSRVLNDPDMAIKEYELALKRDRNDYKLYYELDKLYAFYGMDEKRYNLINKIPDHLAENDIIAERMASYYADVKDFDKALEILHRTKFHPLEFYTEVRRIYEDANIGRGIFLTASGRYREAIESFKEVLKYPGNIGVGEPAKKGHAEVHYRIGIAFEKLGELDTARKQWKIASEEEHSEWNALRYYEAKALQCLGKNKEADSIFESLLTFAQNALVNDHGDRAENLYLSGLALKGRGHKINAIKHFRSAAAIKNTHRRCRWELAEYNRPKETVHER